MTDQTLAAADPVPADASYFSRFRGMRDFLLVWTGLLISGIGTRFSAFALGIWVLEKTKSTVDFAMIFVAMSIPALIVLPFAGALVDRWNRRRVMIACELGSAITIAVLATLNAFDLLQLWHIYVGVGVSALCNAFMQPAYGASVPLLASRENLSRANGLIQTGNAIALLGGPLLAGILYKVIGIAGILFVDAATFLAGAICLFLARVPQPPHDPAAAKPNILREAHEGLRYITERRGLFGLLTVFGITNFFFGIASIAIYPLVLSMGTPETVSYQMVAGGLGLLLGGAIVTFLGWPKHKAAGILACTMLGGVAMAAHGVHPSIWLIMVCGFALFVTIPIVNAAISTLWQTKVPSQLLGRCFAILRVMTEAAMPVGYLLAGPLADYVFEPALMPGGLLADTVGELIGVGKGRGHGFMFVVLGIAMVVAAAIGYSIRAIRRADTDLPDAAASATATPAA